MIAASAPAKINLGLHILRRRPDRYHDLETVFLPIGWADTVTVESAAALTFTCDDEALNTSDNLCMRAARILREQAGTDKGARIHLAKRIPYGAGLGGGSSDAATTLRLLVRLWNIDPGAVDLHAIARSLGADVPFFMQDDPAFATGIGDELHPVSPDDSYAFPFHLVVAVPETRVSTAEAYWQVKPNDEGRPDLRAIVRSNDAERWRRELVNDFEEGILDAFPEIAALKQSLLDAGAACASLSGSGSAVYGVFEDAAPATAAAEALRGSGHSVWRG